MLFPLKTGINYIDRFRSYPLKNAVPDSLLGSVFIVEVFMGVSIRSRLFILFLVPLGFFFAREGMTFQKNLTDAKLYKSQQKNTLIMGVTGDLVTALQRERGLSSIYASSGKDLNNMQAERTKVDESLDRWIQEVSSASYIKNEKDEIPQKITTARFLVDEKRFSSFYEVFDIYTETLLSGYNSISSNCLSKSGSSESQSEFVSTFMIGSCSKAVTLRICRIV